MNELASVMDVQPIAMQPELGPEAVRLVIWDLDETFWRGTLTEGGIEHVPAHQDIVRTLAERGIVSAICSKNDFGPVRDILIERGIWDSFVFPSIDWTAKGPRIAAMVEAIGLRPATVLFIDDNPMNLAEVKHFLPGIQVASEKIIPALLDHPLLRGKDDGALTRLAQYKLLERRADEQARSGGDTTAFLRASNIRVTILHDVSGHLDRVIELINRTNQLNFTKKRLPEDIEAARAELTSYLDTWKRQVGLIRVVDDYGDYGFCGFYSFNSHFNFMEHFCFSCRTLGMGVEGWLYQRLGRPRLDVVGDVLSDIKAESNRLIDWIQVTDSIASTEPVPPRLDRVYLRGACDLSSVGHYLGLVAKEVQGEFNVNVAGQNMRLDHSIFLRYAAEQPSEAACEALAGIGFTADVMQSRFREYAPTADVVLFSFAADAKLLMYRDRATGIVAPFHINRRGFDNGGMDLTKFAAAELDDLVNPPHQAAIRRLHSDFECVGAITKAEFLDNMRVALACIGLHVPVILTLLIEQRAKGTEVIPMSRHIEINGWSRELAAAYPNVKLLDYLSCLSDPSPREDPLHFDREAYYRMHERVLEIVDEFVAQRRLAA